MSVVASKIQAEKIDAALASIETLGIPEKKAKQLHNAGIDTIDDLLRFFPTGYTDYTKAKAVCEIEDGMDCVVIGKTTNKRFGGSSKVSILSVSVEDDFGSKITATWFNQAYVGNTILMNTRYAFCGKVKLDKTGKYPPTIAVNKFSAHTESIQRIMPRYRKVKGMAEAYLVELIRTALERYTINDYLQKRFVTACSLMSEDEAIRELHYPSSEAKLEKARERIDFDTLLPFAFQLMKKGQEKTRPSTFAIPKFSYMQKIAKSLPYSLTRDQKKTINDITAKINSLQQLNALVQGDVGCGKTIVATMLLAGAAESGYQGCLLAPTEVLAKQHFKEIKECFKIIPDVRVELLVGSMKAPQKNKLLKEIKSGAVDIVIGTHAIIQKSVVFKELGIAVIDEQHRFGVAQSEHLLKENNPHIIAMSATPIPRTLSMAIYGEHTEVYNILEKPAGRQQIQTAIVSKPQGAYKFIYDQINKGRQAYIVCPFIESSEDEKLEDIESVKQTEEEVSKIFAFDPQIKIASVTGKMKKEEIDERISAFAAGDIHILISTTVIEVGVNVPNSTVMMIKNAERFGLAQLHQLRGRVGRTTHKSFCILQTDKNPERCEVLCKTTDGFKIAMEDIRLRGHGSYLGDNQTGKDKAVELMITKPALYKKAQDVSRFIDSDADLKREFLSLIQN
jgi:ATP-dependent DNA helicase RecG